MLAPCDARQWSDKQWLRCSGVQHKGGAHAVAVERNPSVQNPEVAQTAVHLHLWRLTTLLKYSQNAKTQIGPTQPWHHRLDVQWEAPVQCPDALDHTGQHFWQMFKGNILTSAWRLTAVNQPQLNSLIKYVWDLWRVLGFHHERRIQTHRAVFLLSRVSDCLVTCQHL